MSWLDSIELLAQTLQRQSDHWICFFQYESKAVFQHPDATDYSISSKHNSVVLQAAHSGKLKGDVLVRCSFFREPRVECQEFVAEKFFNNPAVQSSSPGVFLIPYYAADELTCELRSPFLKFACPDALHLRGWLSDVQPDVQIEGSFFKSLFPPEHALSAPASKVIENQRQGETAKLNTNSGAKNSGDWAASESRESLCEMFEALQNLMRDGECYLANASTRRHGPARKNTKITLVDFAQQWVQSPSRFGVYVHCGESVPAVVCFSPERFLLREGGLLQTEPIKGTAPFCAHMPDGGSSQLWNSTKEMCEQKMICDLLRNDLNTVCAPGTVSVVSPYEVKSTGTLLQMQSVVRGELEDRKSSHADLLKKMLPAGSISGTPKFAVGKYLRTLEQTERGYYTGLFALSDGAERLESTILIRGFFADSEKWTAGIGAGITVLSDVESEVTEFDLKWESFAKRWRFLQSDAHPLIAKEHSHSNRVVHSSQEYVWEIVRSDSKSADPRNTPEASGTPHIAQKVFPPLIELCSQADLEHLWNLKTDCVLFVDHQDSFSENLIAALRARGCRVARVTSSPQGTVSCHGQQKDEFESSLVRAINDGVFSALVLSPGPGRPEDYPLSWKLLQSWLPDRPLLGVCLGHQILLSSEGCQLERVDKTPVHGREAHLIHHATLRLMGDLTLSGPVTFYNSWCVRCDEFVRKALNWTLCASVADTVAACSHRSNPWFAVQFHPESFASEPGGRFLDAFVAISATPAIAFDS